MQSPVHTRTVRWGDFPLQRALSDRKRELRPRKKQNSNDARRPSEICGRGTQVLPAILWLTKNSDDNHKHCHFSHWGCFLRVFCIENKMGRIKFRFENSNTSTLYLALFSRNFVRKFDNAALAGTGQNYYYYYYYLPHWGDVKWLLTMSNDFY